MIEHTENAREVTTYDELENLFVNNDKLEKIESYINRFNPIKIMKMERMEIRHSAILGWLLDPNETHGFDDKFLKAFLSDALKGQDGLALEISQSDLRDADVRREWQNIDIFISSENNGWAFIIENKFESRQSPGQLKRYRKVGAFKSQGSSLQCHCIFLTLRKEEPEDTSYATIRYRAVCKILDRLLKQNSHQLSNEIKIFLFHYLDIIKEATGMSDDSKNMKKIARQLYRDHKKVLDFVLSHRDISDFEMAAQSLIGEQPKYPKYASRISIDKKDYIFGHGEKDCFNFLPYSWYEALGGYKFDWEGCEEWAVGYPLSLWFELSKANDGTKGELLLYGEVGPLSDHNFRKNLIESIQRATVRSSRFDFQSKASDEKNSNFLKKNSIALEDIQNPDDIEKAMLELLRRFQKGFDAIASVLPQFRKYGVC